MYALWKVEEDECQIVSNCFTQKQIEFTYKQKTYSIQQNQIKKIKGALFYYESKPRNWTVVNIQDSFIFGRNECEQTNRWISCHQFKIENHILYHLGKNNTYVNGKKVLQKNMQDGDQILVFGYIFYYFENYLICSQPLKKATSILCEPSQLKIHIPNAPQKELEMETVEIEPFKNIPDVPSIPLFQTISSSSMMLISTLVGIFIQAQMQPQRIQDIVWMSITNFTMAISCIGIGCINRTLQTHQNQKQKAKEEQKYKEYLEKTLQQSIQILEEINLEFEHLKEQYDQLQIPKGPLKIPIQVEKQSTSLWNLPKLGYEYESALLYPYLIESYEKSFIDIQHWTYFESNQKIWIQSGQYKEIYTFFNHQTEQMKWVWVGEVEDEYTWQSCCMYERKRLWIHNLKQIAILNDLYQKQIPYVLCVVCEGWLEKIPQQYKKTLLYCSKKASQETFDRIYSHVDLKSYPKEKLRIPCIKNEWMKYSWNQTFSIPILEDLNIQKVRKHQTNLKIPIGFCKQEMIELDLKDAHGLVAGTTGSGKSEFLISLLFQLCVRFSSKNMQYILVDFKGGAFSSAFEQFNHCAGVITNLDNQEMERFQISLQSEMEQRQKKLAQFLKRHPNETAHIDTYNQYEDTMSHVFIIVDEFAQLKTMYPDMLQYLIEIARIGRSLGIHLILSTQKPSGIVDEQIWANSKFRICFRVQSASDSREVLMHEKAFHLKGPGQFYLQEEMEEKKGTSLYSQEIENIECMPRWQWDAQENEEGKEEKVCESLTKKILQCPDSRRWIVQPSLKHMESHQVAIVDDPYQQRISEWTLEYGQSCLLLISKASKKKTWQTLLLSQYENVYIWNQNVNQYSYWQLLEETNPFTLIIPMDALDISIFQKPNIRLFCYHDVFELNWKYIFTYKIASSCLHADSLKNAFHQFDIKNVEYPYAWMQKEEKVYAFKWNSHPIEKHHTMTEKQSIVEPFTNHQYKQVFSKAIVGWQKDTYLPISIDISNPCIFLYADKQEEQYVKELFQLWKQMGLSHQAEYSHIDTFVSDPSIEQYVWIGYGCNEYVYRFSKTMVFETSDIVYWNKNQIIQAERIRLQNE